MRSSSPRVTPTKGLPSLAPPLRGSCRRAVPGPNGGDRHRPHPIRCPVLDTGPRAPNPSREPHQPLTSATIAALSANPNTPTEQPSRYHQSQQTQKEPRHQPPHTRPIFFPTDHLQEKNPPNHQPPITKPSNTLKIRQSTRHNPHAKPNQTQPPPTTDQPPRLCVSRCKSTILTGPPMRYAQN